MNTDDAARLLTIPEVADRLQVSTKTVRRLTATGEIRGVRVGGQWRFAPDVVGQLLSAA
jgi:excisionase family DNA binding protein